MKYLLASVFLLTSVNVGAGVLWKNAEYGMSVEQVIAAVADTTAYSGETTQTGFDELVRVPSLVIDETPFFASFYFKSGKLTKVMLHSMPRHFVSEESFNTLFTSLSTKYGEPLSKNSPSGGWTKVKDASWVKDQALIKLRYYKFDTYPADITIEYSEIPKGENL